MTTLAIDLAVVLAAAAMLFYLGLPWSVLLRVRGSDACGERTALLGLCVLVAASWQWVDLTGRSLSSGLITLALLNLPAFVWGVRRGWRGWSGLGRGLLGFMAAATACLAVFAYYYRDSLAGPRPEVVSLGNSDLPYYAILAQHLLHHGLQAHGVVAGAGLGSDVRLDVVGAFVLIAAVAFSTHLDIAVVLMPVLLLGVLVTVSALTRLLVAIGGLRRGVALAVAVTACSSSMYYYSVGNGFLAQLFGMALFVSLLAVLAERLQPVATGAAGLRSRAAVGEVALLLIGLVSVYPHMLFLGVPVLIAIAAGAALLGGQRVRDSLWASGVFLSLGLLVTVVVVGSRVVAGVSRTFHLGGLAAGWPLNRAQPAQLAGLARYPEPLDLRGVTPQHALVLTPDDLPAVGALLVVVVLALLLLRRLLSKAGSEERRRLSWCLACAAVPLVSYFLVFAFLGRSYQQWKWLVFFQPVIVASTLVLLALVLQRALSARPVRRLPEVAVQLAPVTAALLLSLSAPRYPHAAQSTDASRAVAEASQLAGAPGVNVEVRTPRLVWDGMWVGYFLRTRSVVLVSRTYFPAQAPDPRFPTLILLPGGGVEVDPPTAVPRI